MRPLFYLISIILVLSLTLTTVCLAQQQVYTWTDKNGVVHYDDQPPPDGKAALIDAPEAYRPGSVGAYPETATADGADAQATEPSIAEQRRADLAKRRQQQAADQADMAVLCGQAEAQVAQLEPHRRVFYQDENGETVRMDDVERVSKVKELKDFIAANCQD